MSRDTPPGSSAAASLVVGVLLVTFTTPALAQSGDPLVTDRPDFTESAATVAPGRVQAEAGYTHARTDDVRAHTVGELLLRIGVLRRVELRVGASSLEVVNGPGGEVRGLGDASLGAKLLLTDGAGAFPTTAVLTGTSLPVGADAVTAGAWQPTATLAVAWELRRDLGLGANVGWTRADDSGQTFQQGHASAALGWTVTGRTGVFLEAFGFSSEGAGGDPAAHLDGGTTLLLSPDLQLDARVGTRLTGSGPDWSFGFGAALRR